MGEEADGQYMLPEDYGALYLQWATALHRMDPALKLGGPSFTGENHDIEVWADANGKVSWTGRFIDYFKQHGRMNDLAFFSFEHYPYEPCRFPGAAFMTSPIGQPYHAGVEGRRRSSEHADIHHRIQPVFRASETSSDIFSGLWLADYIGSFSMREETEYFFHYLPLQMEHGCNDSPGTFGMFTVDANYKSNNRSPSFSRLSLSIWNGCSRQRRTPDVPGAERRHGWRRPRTRNGLCLATSRRAMVDDGGQP